MENKAEKTSRQKYEEAKKAGDLEAMFKIVDNGKQLYCARSRCNGIANFIKRKVPRIKHHFHNCNWFSIQQIHRAEEWFGDEENCCVQITLQPRSSRKTKANPIQTLFTELGLCKSGGRPQPLLCNYGTETNHVSCFSFADRPLSCMFDKNDVERGVETLLAIANPYSLMKL